MQKIKNILYLMAVIVMTSCYDGSRNIVPAGDADSIEADMMRFESAHHYGINYNFIVTADSLLLKSQLSLPAEYVRVDTQVVYNDELIVVADISTIPDDITDSVWVKVARDQETMGWIHESELIDNVVPDDPISQFISMFSDTHLLIFLIFIVGISAVYIVRRAVKRKAHIVHFNDIPTPYPMVLAVIVACSASFYASIQMFAPDTWQDFYYNPTLNPFAVPPILSVFLLSVWAMLVVSIATVDDVRRYLQFGDAVLYLLGLMGICSINYIIFSVTTLYYIGYIILVAYVIFAFVIYHKKAGCAYVCGSCGARMMKKGRCPECGAMNE